MDQMALPRMLEDLSAPPLLKLNLLGLPTVVKRRMLRDPHQAEQILKEHLLCMELGIGSCLPSLQPIAEATKYPRAGTRHWHLCQHPEHCIAWWDSLNVEWKKLREGIA